MDYATLVSKIGSLHSLLRELAQANQFQGEHTIVYRNTDGEECTLHAYIEGTELQIFDSPSTKGFDFSLFFPDED